MSTGLLFLCAIVLTGMVVLELTESTRIPSPVPVSASSVAELVISEPATFEAPPPDPFSVISDRPLFVASRRPFESPPLEPEPATAAVEEPSPLKARLVGVMLTGRGQHALISQPDQPGPERLHLGQTVDGWRFEALEPDRAVFHKSGEVQVLELHPR